jgi:hypothetical protein
MILLAPDDYPKRPEESSDPFGILDEVFIRGQMILLTPLKYLI